MDAQQWNDRYGTAEYIWKADPNIFLVEQTADLSPGRAVDLACGEGRNAVWLAEQGWTVTGVDFSDVGLDKGRRLATERGVDVDWVCADATTWKPPDAGYDLVAVFYLQLPARPAPPGHGRRRPGRRARGHPARRRPRHAPTSPTEPADPPTRPCSTPRLTCWPTSRRPVSASPSTAPTPSPGPWPAPSDPRSTASSAPAGSRSSPSRRRSARRERVSLPIRGTRLSRAGR